MTDDTSDGLRVLKLRGLPAGWRVVQLDSGHYIVIDPAGEQRSCITVNHWAAFRWAKQLAREGRQSTYLEALG